VKFEETPLAGAYLIHQERLADERGFFARTWSREEFAAHGLATEIVHCNTSFNHRRGTLRGMHWQQAPYAEAKLVRCTSGAIHDVIVDLRPGSTTYGESFGATLSAAEGTMLYCPEHFAHGFITLTDDTEIAYQMSQVYSPDHARGARWDDPFFGIEWPLEPAVMTNRDRSYPDFAP
jgi:dTDP-4-dehydrorhamnose 3,5-epimerase